jgi:hypothetical protein
MPPERLSIALPFFKDTEHAHRAVEIMNRSRAGSAILASGGNYHLLQIEQIRELAENPEATLGSAEHRITIGRVPLHVLGELGLDLDAPEPSKLRKLFSRAGKPPALVAGIASLYGGRPVAFTVVNPDAEHVPAFLGDRFVCTVGLETRSTAEDCPVHNCPVVRIEDDD